jgi:thiol-disulfide isomerase/thioredoxin
MRKLGFAIIVLAACGLITIVACQDNKKARAPVGKLLPVGELAPDWKLSDAEGGTHTLADYRGKIIVMDFWATWCGPCKEVMPRMQKLYDRYHDEAVVVFGIDSWENSDPIAFMKKKRYRYGLLLKGEDIAPAYRVTTLPSVYIIGADGRVIYSHEGVDEKNPAELIEKYLKPSGLRGAASLEPGLPWWASELCPVGRLLTSTMAPVSRVVGHFQC